MYCSEITFYFILGYFIDFAHAIWDRKHMKYILLICLKGFPGGSDGEESSCNAEDPDERN